MRWRKDSSFGSEGLLVFIYALAPFLFQVARGCSASIELGCCAVGAEVEVG